MDSGTSPSQETHDRDFRTEPGPDPGPGDPPQASRDKVLAVGQALAQTVRHFWPDFPSWLDDLPDTRFQPYCTYSRRFLVWWGLLLFACKLGRTRELDYQLRDLETGVLPNVNALAQTEQESLPVYGTLSHFLGHVGSEPLGRLRTQMVRQLIRNKVFDDQRLLGAVVVVIDGTGHVSFGKRHCPHCLTQTHGDVTYYYHQVLEAKLITASGLALSLGSEFIDNHHFSGPADAGQEARKQDCELKAFARLAAELKCDFPQLRLCLSADALMACGAVLQTCTENEWHYVLTFKPGHMPAIWEDFQGLLSLCPGQVRRLDTPDGRHLEYRWVNGLSYTDDQGRSHTFDAIQCRQTQGDTCTTFAWITDWSVTADNVIAIAEKGGRDRWTIENQGFNTQKNGGYELEHVYGAEPDLLKCFYFLLQIAHIILQLLEKGSLLRRTALQYGKSVLALYGSLRNIARRLLDCLRYRRIPAEAFQPNPRIQIRLDSS